jgi:hypothetical protein
MNRTLVAAALALCSQLASAAAPASDVASEIIALEKQSWVAWQGHDGAFFERFLSADHVEVGFGGPADKATVVKTVAGTRCSVESYAVDRFTATAIDAVTVLLVYHAAQKTTCGGKPVPSPVWASSLYRKRDGRWENVAYQQSAAAG